MLSIRQISWKNMEYLHLPYPAQAMSRKIRILCAREFQNNLKQTVKKQIEENIEDLDLLDEFEITNESIVAKATGSEFIFMGIKNSPVNIKGLPNIDICFIDEGQSITLKSWEFLVPTIFRNKNSDSKIIIALNPDREDDCLYQFAMNPPKSCYTVQISYKNNRHLSEGIKAEIEKMKREDYQKYLNIYEGQLASTTERQIFRNVAKDNLDHLVSVNMPCFVGVDPGWHDPLAAVEIYYFEDTNTIYLANELYQSYLPYDEVIPTLEREFPDLKKARIISDVNEQRLIAVFKKKNFNIRTAKKTNKSVLAGIRFIQGHKLVISPRCPNALQEFTKYSWKVDKMTDEVLINDIAPNQPDHCIDSVRYRRWNPRDLLVIRGLQRKDILGRQDHSM